MLRQFFLKRSQLSTSVKSNLTRGCSKTATIKAHLTPLPSPLKPLTSCNVDEKGETTAKTATKICRLNLIKKKAKLNEM